MQARALIFDVLPKVLLLTAQLDGSFLAGRHHVAKRIDNEHILEFQASQGMAHGGTTTWGEPEALKA